MVKLVLLYAPEDSLTLLSYELLKSGHKRSKVHMQLGDVVKG